MQDSFFVKLKMTNNLWVVFLALCVSTVTFHSSFIDGRFVKDMYISWGTEHSVFLESGDDATLVLDQYSGSGMQSNGSFLFGSIEMQIKLPAGNSAGTVTAYYLSSTGGRHDEIDFEFIGNVSGEPYTVHTNVYTLGGGGREQQFYLWFDPTEDYHNYTIHWNPIEIVWYVDGVPIRVYKNYLSDGIPYPNQQAMTVYSSIWNADSWATRGGLDKIDWNAAPFVARFRGFRLSACQYDGPVSIKQCAASTPEKWWNSPPHTQLSSEKQKQMNSVRNKYMIYDYCKDIKRFRGWLPGECFKPQF